ncbi:hypothetical protein [Bosea lathyri]|uniref:Uncharacterized protein n=1 Tax=Bosea lathyri TaxID=1036778 RepID=A0A1H6BFZ8_9HYPH|nr:hypothetical protein [Bosea lathyri]SEG59245.1 hypothetical protein SAMN04488115_107185 [Bosea lathyri]
MPAGAQVYFPGGVDLLFEVTDRLTRFLGILYVPAGTSGSVVNDGFLTGAGVCACLRTNAAGANFMNNTMVPPAIGFSGNTMTYGASPGDHLLFYGVH